MVTFLFFAWLFLSALLSAETVVSTLIEILVAVGATQAIKKMTGLGSLGSTAIALVVSFVVGIIAFSVSTIAAGNELSFNVVAGEATKIFTLATIAYRVVSPLLNGGGGDDEITPDLGDGDAV